MRHELADCEWAAIKPMLPNKPRGVSRVWVLARPLSGFAETFSHYLIDLAPGGGSELPEPDKDAEGALFVVGGRVTLTLDGAEHVLRPGSA